MPAESEDRRGLTRSWDGHRPALGRPLKRRTIETPTPEGPRWGFKDARGSTQNLSNAEGQLAGAGISKSLLY